MFLKLLRMTADNEEADRRGEMECRLGHQRQESHNQLADLYGRDHQRSSLPYRDLGCVMEAETLMEQVGYWGLGVTLADDMSQLEVSTEVMIQLGISTSRTQEQLDAARETFRSHALRLVTRVCDVPGDDTFFTLDDKAYGLRNNEQLKSQAAAVIYRHGRTSGSGPSGISYQSADEALEAQLTAFASLAEIDEKAREALIDAIEAAVNPELCLTPRAIR